MSGIIAQNTLDNSGLIKAPAGGGAWNFISKQTASSDSTIDFTSGIDSTYKEYIFTFNNIHPSEDDKHFTFQGNASGGSGYNETMTTTTFQCYHTESDGSAGDVSGLSYYVAGDQAQGTAFQLIGPYVCSDNDSGCSGYLHLFNPSSDVFVKHFMAVTVQFDFHSTGTYLTPQHTAGYFNTTSAIDEIQFKMSSGDIDLGDICLYGLTT